jgi:TRAP-type C4-dicarboxylate transport system substrate-binding protein
MLALLGTALSARGADLKIATVAPDRSPWMDALRTGANEIRQTSEGRVNLKLYGSGVMGTDRQVLRKIRIGQLQGGVFTSATLATLHPDVAVYGLPLVFRSQAEVDYVRQRMDARLSDGLLKQGYLSLGFVSGGFALLMSREPVRQLADLDRRKIWIPEGDTVSTASLQALGLAPVALPITDVLTGLQTGLIDIVAAPPAGAIALQWHTRMKYVTDLPLAYTFAALVIDAKAFAKLAAGDQAIVRDVLGRVQQTLDRRAAADNANAAAALTKAGLRPVAPAANGVAAWRRQVATAQNQMAANGVIGRSVMDELTRLLAEHRGSGATASAAGGAAVAIDR